MAKDKQSCYNLFLMTEKKNKASFWKYYIFFQKRRKILYLIFDCYYSVLVFITKQKKNITRFLAEDVNLSLESSNMLHMTS